MFRATVSAYKDEDNRREVLLTRQCNTVKEAEDAFMEALMTEATVIVVTKSKVPKSINYPYINSIE